MIDVALQLSHGNRDQFQQFPIHVAMGKHSVIFTISDQNQLKHKLPFAALYLDCNTLQDGCTVCDYVWHVKAKHVHCKVPLCGAWSAQTGWMGGWHITICRGVLHL